MKKFVFLVLVLFTFIQISSQTLHTLLFVDDDFKRDMRVLSTFFSDIANSIDYESNLVKVCANDFTPDIVKDKINDLKVKSNDIVIFYFSGHGENEKIDKWPSLIFNNDKFYRQPDIQNLLNAKAENAKLILCIADCCNKESKSWTQITKGVYEIPIFKNDMKKLFTEFEGRISIIVSSSEKGQLGWGGCFIKSFIEANKTTTPIWRNVLEETTISTERRCNYYYKKTQTPQYEITIF